MIYPEYNEFQERVKNYNRIVVYREVAGDLITPITLLHNFSHEENLFLLESANLDKSFSRFTFFGIRPQKILRFQKGSLTVESSEEGIVHIDENPIDYMTDLLKEESSYKSSNFGDFCGGYVGFMGYDMANYMGILRKKIREDEENLSMAFFQVDEFYVFDNRMGKLYAAISVVPGIDTKKSYDNALKRTLEMGVEILSMNHKFSQPFDGLDQSEDFAEDEYIERVESLKKEIINGECIQTVLSNRYEINCRVNPVNLYRTLRNINPSPYMFYIKLGEDVLCGTSPEIHLKITDGIATLKPIAGTYKYTKENCERAKDSLLKDEKEVAEHLMLLDLARNDLYTGCEPETVTVVDSFKPEVYSHVIHIVSEVQGKIKKDIAPMRLFSNTFPAGTVSGAPKIRAMELIDKYEKTPRGFYAGCAGYFSYSQDIDTCIVIRSAYVKKDKVILRAGAGIVYDSVPESEYLEVGIKLGALFAALKQIELLETKNVFNDR
jgi:anthranilate synthase component 1